MAHRLPQDQITADAAEALRQSSIDVDIVVNGVLQWLSLPSNQHWLLIIDDADRDHLHKDRDPQACDVKMYFPSADHGSILITSRLASLERLGFLLLRPPSPPPSYPLGLIATRSVPLLLALLALPTAAFSAAMEKRKVTAEELLARDESNVYKRGAHREKDNTRDEKRHIDMAKKDQNAALDRYIL